MLVVTPSPKLLEGLYGYILRVSEANGYVGVREALLASGYKSIHVLPTGLDLGKLSVSLNGKNLLGVSYEDLPKFERKNGDALEQRICSNLLDLGNPNVCPKCLSDRPIALKLWDLKLVVACPEHGCLLLRKCHECGDKIDWNRPGVNECNCGALFSDAITPAASEELTLLTRLINGVLHNHQVEVDALGFPNIDCVEASIKEFSFISRMISRHLGCLYDSDLAVANQLAFTLSNWPHNFHNTLVKMDEVLGGHQKPSVSFLRQFFYIERALLRSSSLGQLDCFRNEFLHFGARIWGKGILSNAVMERFNINVPLRYTSVCDASRLWGVRGSKVVRWCESNLVESTKIIIDGEARYIVDLETPNAVESIQGHAMNARSAARYTGFPVSLLEGLKKSESYLPKYQPLSCQGFHEFDLDALKERFVSRAPLVQMEELTGCDFINTSNLFRDVCFYFESVKVDFFLKYVQGEIEAIGRTSDELASVYFDRKVVKHHIKISLEEGPDASLTATKTGEILGVSRHVVNRLLEKNYLVSNRTVNGGRRPTLDSLTNFKKRYIFFSKARSELEVSAKQLEKICDQLSIPFESIVVTLGRNSWIARFYDRFFFTQIEEYIQSNASMKPRGLKVKLKVLESYLANLRSTETKLPRYGSRVSILGVAQASGISRTCLYEPKIQQLLASHKRWEIEKYNLCNKTKIQVFESYAESIVKQKRALPIGKMGRANKKEIAKICGFDRVLFYQNSRAMALLTELELMFLSDFRSQKQNCLC